MPESVRLWVEVAFNVTYLVVIWTKALFAGEPEIKPSRAAQPA
jgi:hypothetical protein